MDDVRINIDGEESEEEQSTSEEEPNEPPPYILNNKEWHWVHYEKDQPKEYPAYRFNVLRFLSMVFLDLLVHYAFEAIGHLLPYGASSFLPMHLVLLFKLSFFALTFSSSLLTAYLWSWDRKPVHLVSVVRVKDHYQSENSDLRTDIQSLSKLKHKEPLLMTVHRQTFLAMPRTFAPESPYFRNSPHWKMEAFDVSSLTHTNYSFDGYVLNASKIRAERREFVVSFEQVAQLAQKQSVGGLPRADAVRKINIWARTPPTVANDRYSIFGPDREGDHLENARIVAQHILMDYLDSQGNIPEDF